MIKLMLCLIILIIVGGLILLAKFDLDPEEENKAIHEKKKAA